MIRRAAIVSPVRTGIGAFGGGLRDASVEHLGATVARAVVERSGVDPALMGGRRAILGGTLL